MALISQFIDDVKRQCVANRQPFGLREVLFCIRDIPYGRPASTRDAAGVLSEWKGTCSGKHLLAQAVAQFMGFESTLYCLPYQVRDALQTLPAQLIIATANEEAPLWDVHNYLELRTPSRSTKVDVTWSRELAEFGFATTLRWNGTEDFRLAAPPGDAIAVDRGAQLNSIKKQLLERLNTHAGLVLRERFIEGLAVYASQHSSAHTRADGIAGTLKSMRSLAGDTGE